MQNLSHCEISVPVPDPDPDTASVLTRDTPVYGRSTTLTRLPAGVLMTLAVCVVPDQLPAAVIRQGELVITDPVPFLQHQTVYFLQSLDLV